MSNQKIKTRVQNKYDFKDNWDKATNFIPLKGEIVTIAPSASSADADAVALVNENIPHRIKIGDGSHKLSELSYIDRPRISQVNNSEIDLYGFDSITTLQPGDATLNLRFNQNATNSAVNYELQEFMHHKLFASVNTNDSENRSVKITLAIAGDGTDVADGIKASDINIFFKPSKCTMPTWHTGAAVTNQKATVRSYEVTELSIAGIFVSTGKFEYVLTLPNDKTEDGDFVFNDGRFLIDISCFISKLEGAGTNIDILIENEYLACCTKNINNIT